jgi:hypothetical protein
MRSCACVCAFAVAIWRDVAEGYAPFHVDVTTIEPVGVAATDVFHVCIGGLSSDLSAGLDSNSVCCRDNSSAHAVSLIGQSIHIIKYHTYMLLCVPNKVTCRPYVAA